MRQPVIIRAYADEPVKLTAVGIRGRSVDCFGKVESKTMPFHLSRAYRFQDDVYDELRKAFDEKRADDLAKLWDQAESFS